MKELTDKEVKARGEMMDELFKRFLDIKNGKHKPICNQCKKPLEYKFRSDYEIWAGCKDCNVQYAVIRDYLCEKI